MSGASTANGIAPRNMSTGPTRPHPPRRDPPRRHSRVAPGAGSQARRLRGTASRVGAEEGGAGQGEREDAEAPGAKVSIDEDEDARSSAPHSSGAWWSSTPSSRSSSLISAANGQVGDEPIVEAVCDKYLDPMPIERRCARWASYGVTIAPPTPSKPRTPSSDTKRRARSARVAFGLVMGVSSDETRAVFKFVLPLRGLRVSRPPRANLWSKMALCERPPRGSEPPRAPYTAR